MEERQAHWFGEIPRIIDIVNVIIFSERYYLTKYILEILVFQLALADFNINGNEQQLRTYLHMIEQVRFFECILLCSERFNLNKHFAFSLIFDLC